MQTELKYLPGWLLTARRGETLLRPTVSKKVLPLDVKKFGKSVNISPTNICRLKDIHDAGVTVTVTFGEHLEGGPMDVILESNRLEPVNVPASQPIRPREVVDRENEIPF